MYGCLMCATLLWQLFFSVGLDKASFSTNTRLSSALIGGYLGVSWAGVSIWFLALGAATGRMRREIPGLMAPLKVQIAVWLVGALAEETWRVTAIAALVTSRNSPLFSVVAVSVALDRKSVVEGKSVDLGGRRIIKKKKNKIIRMILSFIRG